MTANELGILRHSIGMDDYGRGREFRNHFCAGGDDVAACRGLVERGLMVERPASDMSGGDPWFYVTDAGKDIARRKSAVVERGQ